MIDLYLLKYFLAVVETGNFTRAAKRVFVTQPTLSAGIKKLESQAGHALFERTNKRVFLTDAGARFLPRAKAIMHECNMALATLADGESAPVLRIGVLNSLSHHWVSHVLGSFRARHNDMVIEVMDVTAQELQNRLDDRSLDYGFGLYHGEGTDVAIPLGEEGYVFILGKDHPLANRKTLTAKDIPGERMIVRSHCEVLSETSRYFTDQNVRPRLIYRTANDARAIAMVAAGLGGTLIPESLLGHPGITAFALDGFSYRRRLCLLKPRYDQQASLKRLSLAFEQHVKTTESEG